MSASNDPHAAEKARACANPECDHDRTIPSPGCALRSGENEPLVVALVARLLRDNLDDCEIVGFTREGRCIEPAVAARFDGVFIDLVCAEHAARAGRTQRVVYPPAKRADGGDA